MPKIVSDAALLRIAPSAVRPLLPPLPEQQRVRPVAAVGVLLAAREVILAMARCAARRSSSAIRITNADPDRGLGRAGDEDLARPAALALCERSHTRRQAIPGSELRQAPVSVSGRQEPRVPSPAQGAAATRDPLSVQPADQPVDHEPA